MATISLLSLGLGGCKKEAANPAAEAPPATPQIVQTGEGNTVTVKAAERFPLVQASLRDVVSKLNVTGTVSPDISRELPVLSLANGRVVALHVRLGDTVRKGQLIMEVQSPDVATAFNGYLKAVNDQHLTAVVLERDKLLYDKGAIAQSQLEIAQNGDDDAKADLKAAEQQLRILGVDRRNPSDTVKVYAPTSGVVISQSTTAAGAAGISYTGANGSLIIADLSHVWVVCDVYENNLADVRLGEHADIRLNAYPDKVYSGTISDIGAVLDPTIRTAKVRIQVNNPNEMMRLGMFATATLMGAHAAPVVVVPAAAVLHLHDREFVFVPAGAGGTFRRVEIKSTTTPTGNSEQVQSGLMAGQSVVANALDLENTADQE